MELDRLEYYISQRLLNLANITVYNTKAASTKVFPYLVFKFTACSHLYNNRADWILEIDYWNDSSDDTTILQAAIDVKKGRLSFVGLDKSTQDEAEGFYKCDIEFEGKIIDTEPDVSRFNQRYLIKLY